MTIATDMIGPLVLLAQTRAALAQQPETAAFAARVQAAIEVLEDLRGRVEAMERHAYIAAPRGPERRTQPTLQELATGAVVSLLEARMARGQGRRP